MLLLVGMGERDKVDAEALRRAAAAAVRQGRGARKAVTTLPQALPTDPAAAVQAVTEGALLAAYRFDKYKQAKANEAKPPELASLAWPPGVGRPGPGPVARALATGVGRRPPTWPATCPTSRPTPCTRPTWPPPP